MIFTRHIFTNKRTALPFIFLSFFTTISSAQEKITLKQAVEITLKNNLQIKQAQLTEALADETLNQSKLALYPNLNSNNSVGSSYGRSIDPTTNQFVNTQLSSGNIGLLSEATLFQGFQKLHQISQNKYLLEADKSNTKKIKNDLTLNVINTYLQVLTNKDILLAAKQQLEVSHQKMDREQQLFDAGSKTLADLSQAKAQLAAAELNVTNAQNQLDLSFLNLAQLLERDPAISFNVEKPIIEEIKTDSSNYSALDVYRIALIHFPEIKSTEYRRIASGKGVEVARGNLYPRIVLQGQLTSRFSNNDQRLVGQVFDGTSSIIGYDGSTNQPVYTPNVRPVYEKTPFFSQMKDNFGQSIAIGVTIPIFNGLSARSSISRAKVNYEHAKVAEQLAKNNLNKVINQAVLDVRAAEKKHISTQAAYIASKDAFDAIEKRYHVGLVNSIDYNKAQTDMNNAQFELIKAEYDLLFRRKTIDFYLGKCLASNDCN